MIKIPNFIIKYQIINIMKKIVVALSAGLLLMTVSCKKKVEKKVEESPAKVTAKETYQVSATGSKVDWTGYKFTEKKGVTGTFKVINILNAPQSDSPIGAFNGVDFTIPVSSIFSKNEIRDGKLKTLFFGMMDNTELLSGSFVTEGDDILLNLKMNNQVKKIPLSYTIANRNVRLKGSLNILDFGATKAFNSIHKACEVLHTGPDKISKTWEEVSFDAIVYLKK